MKFFMLSAMILTSSFMQAKSLQCIFSNPHADENIQFTMDLNESKFQHITHSDDFESLILSVNLIEENDEGVDTFSLISTASLDEDAGQHTQVKAMATLKLDGSTNVLGFQTKKDNLSANPLVYITCKSID